MPPEAMFGAEDDALIPCVCGPNGSCARSCSNRKRAKAKRQRPEAGIQAAIKQRLVYHGIVCVAVPNEGKRSAIAGRAMKHTGMVQGFPDIIAMQAPGLVAFLEVKAEKGRTSPAQDDCHAMLRRLGHFVAVVRSSDAAVEALRGAGFRISER